MAGAGFYFSQKARKAQILLSTTLNFKLSTLNFIVPRITWITGIGKLKLDSTISQKARKTQKDLAS